MQHDEAFIAMVAGAVGRLILFAVLLAASRRLRLPYSVVLVVAGMILAELARAAPGFFGEIAAMEITSDLVLFVFLPTLIFESAYNLDARLLRRNLAEVMALAGPGLILSTAMIGCIVALLTSASWAPALLLGAILSATDPVAVIALFGELGAPRRLLILVEGESLFNDATAIVLTIVLVGILRSPEISAWVAIDALMRFAWTFVGGLAAGWLLGRITGIVLGCFSNDAILEITLTTILAYASYLVADAVLHLSGVMATVGAGLAIGGRGRLKMSPAVRNYLDNFWEYMAFLANACIFLMVGLRIDLAAIWGAGDLAGVAIIAMLVSRAAVIYGLMPITNRLHRIEPVDRRYQTVLFWGGLRGAVALALVLCLPRHGEMQAFADVVIAAVLFTLLAQGMTIRPLMRWLGLDQPTLPDRLGKLEVELAAHRSAQKRVSDLLASGLFASRVAAQLQAEIMLSVTRIHDAIDGLRRADLTPGQERRLLWLRALAEEKAFHVDAFNQGHLSENAFRELAATVDQQIDLVRYQQAFRPSDLRLRQPFLRSLAARILERIRVFLPWAERLRLARVAMDYEEALGHYQAGTAVLAGLEELAILDNAPREIVDEIRSQYRQWRNRARESIDQMAEQYPEFVQSTQRRLGRRLLLICQAETARAQAEHGALPAGIAEAVADEAEEALRRLRGYEVARLRIEPAELLRKVPFFSSLPAEGFALLADCLQPRTVSAGETVIREGEKSTSLYLIARGVVRVIRGHGGKARDIATLMAGDFFGEMAILHQEPRKATVRAISPCSLYVLQRQDLDEAVAACPGLKEAMEMADRQRRAELEKPGL